MINPAITLGEEYCPDQGRSCPVSGIEAVESLAIKCRSWPACRDAAVPFANRLRSALSMTEIALYQPDIPPNVGTILRLGACLDVPVHIIEPAGFAWSERSLRRAGLDYLAEAKLIRHASYQDFCAGTAGRRQVLLSTKAQVHYTAFRFEHDDILMVGRESSGVPEEVHGRVDARVVIPMRPGMRSLNVATACAMVVGEALRQTKGFPLTP
jgi:tRNA (cytidine/uridine-2'-O-)-methyltransferase